MDIPALDRRLALLWSRPGQRYAAFPGLPESAIGYEERTQRDGYDWDGRKRGGPPAVVAQYTVSGWGSYVDDHGRVHQLFPGRLFLAVIPGDHRYFLPPESAHWRFLYAHIQHPATVQRLADNVREGHAVFAADPDHPCLGGAVASMDGNSTRGPAR